MNKPIFDKWIKNLCVYFEKKLSSETGENWFGEVSKIPEESLSYILEAIKKKESFPRNFPATTWALYHQWLKENKKQAFDNCPDCDGTGWIIDKRRAYRCGNCDIAPKEAFFSNPGFSGNLKIKTITKSNDDFHDQF